LLGAGVAQRYQVEATAPAGDATITRDVVPWNPDPDAARWARWWLFYLSLDMAPYAGDGVWNDPGVWDPDPTGVFPLGVWDSGLTLEQARDFATVPQEWNAAHARGLIVLINPGLEFFGASLVDPGPELWDYPPGLWQQPGAVWQDLGPVQIEI
jgi:hypothetical protein